MQNPTGRNVKLRIDTSQTITPAEAVYYADLLQIRWYKRELMEIVYDLAQKANHQIFLDPLAKPDDLIIGSASSTTSTDFFSTSGCTFPNYNAIGPTSLYVAATNTTWYAWEAWNLVALRREARVKTFNHTTRKWTPEMVAGINPLVDNDHGNPSLCRISTGYVFVFYGSHSTFNQLVAVTRNPDDSYSWDDLSAITAGLAYSHPDVISDVIYLFEKHYDGTDDRYLYLYKTTSIAVNVPTWASFVSIIDYGLSARIYQGTHVIVGTDIHFVACWADSGDTIRQNVYYFVYDSLTGNIRNFDSSVTVLPASQPILLATADASFKLFSHTGSRVTCIPQLAFDSNSHPHVLFGDGPQPTGAGLTTMNILEIWHNGTSWQSPATLGQSTNMFNGATIWPRASGEMGAAWAQDDGHYVRGGNIKQAIKSAAGVWATATTIATAGSTYALDVPHMTRDGLSESRITFTEITQDSVNESGLLKMYAYGDSGLLPVNNGTYSFVNSEASAYAARVGSAQTYDDQSLIDSMFSGLKSIGLSKFDGAYLNGWWAADADCLLNLISTSYPLAKVGGVTFTSLKGYTGNGTTGLLQPPFNPSTAAGAWSQNSMHLSMFAVLTSSNNVIYAGCTDAGAVLAARFSGFQGSSASMRVNDGTTAFPANTNPGGFFAINRSGSNARQMYRNAVVLSSTTGGSTGVPNGTLAFLGDVVSANFSTQCIFCGTMGGTLTATEHTKLYREVFLQLLRLRGWG